MREYERASLFGDQEKRRSGCVLFSAGPLYSQILFHASDYIVGITVLCSHENGCGFNAILYFSSCIWM